MINSKIHIKQAITTHTIYVKALASAGAFSLAPVNPFAYALRASQEHWESNDTVLFFPFLYCILGIEKNLYCTFDDAEETVVTAIISFLSSSVPQVASNKDPCFFLCLTLGRRNYDT